jgi:hypothetical protein
LSITYFRAKQLQRTCITPVTSRGFGKERLRIEDGG